MFDKWVLDCMSTREAPVFCPVDDDGCIIGINFVGSYKGELIGVFSPNDNDNEALDFLSNNPNWQKWGDGVDE